MEKETDGRAPALVISRKGPLRDGLVALLGALPRLGAIETAGSLDEALSASAPERSPILVVLDSRAIGPEVWLGVRRAKARWPEGRCLVLADNVDQQEKAESAGADAVLINGFPPARFDATLVKLLPRVRAEDSVPGCLRDRGKHRTRGGRPGLAGPAAACKEDGASDNSVPSDPVAGANTER